MWRVDLMKVIIIMMINIKGNLLYDPANPDLPFKLTYDVEGTLEAEVGSSLIINCSYTYNDDASVFVPKSFSWYKCEERYDNCIHSEMIFPSSDVNAGQDECKGRVSPLEQNVTKWNTSIVIRDLRVSDTGFYQLWVKGHMNERPAIFKFAIKKPIKVTGLAQPIISGGPTVVEVGANLTLTCEASSSPPSTVTWTKVGSHIPLQTGTERAKLFIPNATRDHSGRYRCTANHIAKTLSAFADISVTEKDLDPPMITGVTTIEEGDTLTLTCEAQSSPLSIVTWTKAGSHIALVTGTEMAKLVILNATRDHSGRYRCSAQHVQTTQTVGSFVDVTILKKYSDLDPPMITGVTTIEEGDTLTLTCEAQSSPLSIVTWTKAGSHIALVTGTEMAKLVILNATRDHSGRYRCSAQHVQTTQTISSFADVKISKKRSDPILELLFSRPGVVTIIISLMSIGVLACIYCLAKAFHRCTTRLHHQVLVGNERPCVQMVITQQTGGRLGVDGVGPEDTQPKSREGEVPDPATTPV